LKDQRRSPCRLACASNCSRSIFCVRWSVIRR
jgi:hypothetical protein